MYQAKNVFFMMALTLIVLTTFLMGSPASAESATKLTLSSKKIAANQNKNGVAKARQKISDVAHPDAYVQAENLHKTANLSYQVSGKRYYPIDKVKKFSQEGTASWYGGTFHGRKTSSGERFDKNIMTAAHPTLPIPSYVRVTNLKNGKTVVLRINDRGPFHSKRVIDVSEAAAKKLGFIQSGVARVRVEQIIPLGKNSKKTDLKQSEI